MKKRAQTVSNADKIGPWLVKDWNDFLNLSVEQPTPRDILQYSSAPKAPFGAVNALAWNYLQGPSEECDKQLATEHAWKVRQTHPVYRWLKKDPHFQRAMELFETKRRAATDGPLTSWNAPFRFLRSYVIAAGLAFRARSEGAPARKRSYAADRRAAIQHANALSGLLVNGIGLDKPDETEKLRELLSRLSSSLKGIRRKDYEDQGARIRAILRSFAHELIAYLDLKSPKLLQHVAATAGLECEEKNAQRYSDAAALQWKPRAKQLALTMAAKKVALEAKIEKLGSRTRSE